MQDHTADSIKSLDGFRIAWVEEAQALSAKSLKLLRPTLRENDAELWFTWNPDDEDDAVEKFFKSMEGSEDSIVVHVNYDDNPFLPDTLKKEMESDRVRFPDDFDHVWLGAYNTRSDVRVFNNWRIDDLKWTGDDMYFGCDWGFAVDPTVILRAFLDEGKKQIYVDYEFCKVGVEIDHLPKAFKSVPLADVSTVRCDSARPETISYMRRQGYKCVAVEKGEGSIEDGVEWLKGYEIVVHPRCKNLAKELRLYSYKTNKAGDILRKIEDANNHAIDALRYAFEPLVKRKRKAKYHRI